jgi:hypothetical protein
MDRWLMSVYPSLWREFALSFVHNYLLSRRSFVSMEMVSENVLIIPSVVVLCNYDQLIASVEDTEFMLTIS